MTLARTESGSASLELALITPVLLLVLMTVVGLGRLGQARAQIDAAAAQAARAATTARTPIEATSRAERQLSAALGGPVCAQLDTSVDTAGFHPGGMVAVDVACLVPLRALTGLGLPGAKLLETRAISVVDAYRGTG